MRVFAAVLLTVCLGWAGMANAQTADGNQTDDTNTNVQTEETQPSDGANSTGEGSEQTEEAPVDEDSLLATTDELEAIAKAKAEAEEAAIVEELEKLIIGGWGRISSRGASGITDANLISGGVTCRRARRITRAEFLDGAETTLPQEDKRRGNVVYYKTGKGLQRLDTAVRKVFLIKSIERKIVDRNRKVWRLSGEKGAVIVGFGTLKRNGRKINVLIEQNAVFIRCPSKASN